MMLPRVCSIHRVVWPLFPVVLTEFFVRLLMHSPKMLGGVAVPPPGRVSDPEPASEPDPDPDPEPGLGFPGAFAFSLSGIRCLQLQ